MKRIDNILKIKLKVNKNKIKNKVKLDNQLCPMKVKKTFTSFK